RHAHLLARHARHASRSYRSDEQHDHERRVPVSRPRERHAGRGRPGQLTTVYQTAGVVQDNGRVARDTVLYGPGGAVGWHTIWDANRLITGWFTGGPSN